MNSPVSTWELASSSRPATPGEGVRGGPRPLRDAPRRWRHQLAADQVEVGQREEAEGPRQILGHAAVAHLREAPVQAVIFPNALRWPTAGPRQQLLSERR